MTVSAPAPVGRTREFRTLTDALSADSPAVLVISGRPGSGRSHLIRHVRDAACAFGYRCIGVDEKLVVDPTTTLSDVRRVLVALTGREAEPLPTPADRARQAGWLQSALDLADKVTEKVRLEKQVFAQLEAAAPLLLAIEGYSPSPAFALWMSHRLIPQLRAADVPVVLVIAGVEESVSGLTDIADAAVTLGLLDLEEIRADLCSHAASIRPPLTEEELDAYAAAAIRDPGLVDAFGRILSRLSSGEDHGSA